MMDPSKPGPSGVKYLSRRDIYNVVESSQEPNFDRKLSFMEETLISKFCKDEDQKKDWKQKLSLIKHQFKSRWHAAHKKKNIFKKNNNDWLGNTSRRFFADHELSASITGVDVNLICRFKIILEALSSGYKINIETFEKYARETEELYVQLYEWHPMSPTIHKILRHGAEVISSALLPIGQLSEEAAEARNKHFRDYRLNYSRKFSREDCNLDVINRLLLTSDPLITGMRKIPKRKSKPFHQETLNLLLPAETPSIDSDSETDTDLNSDNEV